MTDTTSITNMPTTKKKKEITNPPYIKASALNITFGKNKVISDLSIEIPRSQNIAFVGPNGSGKSVLLSYLASTLKVHKQSPEYAIDFDPATDIGVVSFEKQVELYEIDDYFDDTDFMDGVQDKGTLAKDAILLNHAEDEHFEEIVELMNIRYLLDRGIRFLSTGEMRKVLLCRELLNKHKILVIDSPFEGLDKKSRVFLRQRLISIMKKQQCIFLLNENDSLLAECDIIHVLKEGRIQDSGHPKKICQGKDFKSLFPAIHKDFKIPDLIEGQEKLSLDSGTELIKLKNVSVKYGDVTALNNLSWTVKEKENWLISGPNGAGKSTLLSLITADNPQGYGKDFWLFGKKRGSGETIWDIKKRIGIITSSLQLNYKQPLNALQVVVSGFFDSIGLYQQSTPLQVKTAREWLNLLEIKDIHQRYFSELSYGEQRMVLLARAMVKHPLILVLDEPCQGLDYSNRQLILNLIDYIALNTNTTVLYVSHCHDEDLQCINRKLEFFKEENGQFSSKTSSV
ncbi:MAG: ATP-binding cassette domain-containing protein [Lentisphaeraceae bacterium]|nr:ATP-binding cassette domain-containing protein [Lentisphaeraceae bacterium]